MKLSLSSILIFALVTPVIMTYRISPGNTPYFLFGLIFLGILLFILLDIFSLSDKLRFRLKVILLSLMIIFTIGATVFSEIIVRHESSPIYNVHDILVQQEAAIRFLLDGKNPYRETYHNTPLSDWHYSDKEENPALYHFVMQPFYLIFSLPFYPLFGRTIGYFDGRFPLLFLFFLSLAVAFRIIKDGEKRRSFVFLLAFNPLMIYYTLEGRSDFFMFGFLISGFYLLHKNKTLLSAVLIAFAFAVKQSVWPLFPLYITYLWFKNKNKKDLIKPLSVFAMTFGTIVLPFFLWDPKAFLDSTVFYLSGNALHSYPISGYGFGMLLNEFGFINDLKGNFPFIIPQIIVAMPTLALLIN